MPGVQALGKCGRQIRVGPRNHTNSPPFFCRNSGTAISCHHGPMTTANGLRNAGVRAEEARDPEVVNVATTTASKMAEVTDYRGYRLEVGPVGKGWRAAIFAPGSASPLPESPAALEKSTKDAIVTEAKRIIDARLNK
jgi:hypothetical protein